MTSREKFKVDQINRETAEGFWIDIHIEIGPFKTKAEQEDCDEYLHDVLRARGFDEFIKATTQ